MKQNAVKSIFEHFLSDRSIDSNLAHHCYRILQTVIHKNQSIDLIEFLFLFCIDL